MVQNRQLTKDMNEYKEKYLSIQKRHHEHTRNFNSKSKNNMENTIKTLNEKVLFSLLYVMYFIFIFHMDDLFFLNDGG